MFFKPDVLQVLAKAVSEMLCKDINKLFRPKASSFSQLPSEGVLEVHNPILATNLMPIPHPLIKRVSFDVAVEACYHIWSKCFHRNAFPFIHVVYQLPEPLNTKAVLCTDR
jgi:hypothetical protein